LIEQKILRFFFLFSFWEFRETQPRLLWRKQPALDKCMVLGVRPRDGVSSRQLLGFYSLVRCVRVHVLVGCVFVIAGLLCCPLSHTTSYSGPTSYFLSFNHAHSTLNALGLPQHNNTIDTLFHMRLRRNVRFMSAP